mmetsp:Transcript_19118/g.37535  ORF Transcript_19118/g.37535 Transcript_19118/m.37535 type:complete len:337 (+) Transcript_19118:1083-2093(+)|eukprot:CAMPEP_0171517752 /NCGR_PEP_ID=MMETSP0959-20130129/4873_1 /TAXON_ID=87120 /ORGANISM="Aurantiochytrium limacinum, Strain ATCCMYA-1381" /LENGTH=336 /DNA_ID=CAMNT_0012056821 /DNA_START=450 /DNA_END=1460 /DNA_ORIENTATION=+
MALENRQLRYSEERHEFEDEIGEPPSTVGHIVLRNSSLRSSATRSSLGSGRWRRKRRDTDEAADMLMPTHEKNGSGKSFWRRLTRCADDEGRMMLLGEDISEPSDFKHNFHATFDTDTIRFTGLPSEWNQQASVFHKQFGVSLRKVPRVYVEGYPARIPAILVLLRRQLIDHGGLHHEGVFRVSANKSRQELYKQQLDAGQFEGCQSEDDAPCMAALIKEWFRALPKPLLNCLPQEIIENTPRQVDTELAVSELLDALPEPNKSIFLWLIELLADTAKFKEENLMNEKALGIVLAPNLYTVPEECSPLEMVGLMESAVSTVQCCLANRLREKSLEE